MDYEKSYKEALERARNIRFGNPNSAIANVVCEEIFPEIAKSEDEKIRKEILEYIDKATGCKEWIAWLEKQGEQNNIVEQLTAFAQHFNKRGAFRDDLCMDFEHEAQSFIEMQNTDNLREVESNL